MWVLEVFLTEKEVADIKECRANLLERITAKHTLSDVASKRLDTRSPRPYGTWRRNVAPSFRTGLVTASEKLSEHGSGRNSLTSPTWVLKRKTVEAVPSPVDGYHIEAEPQKEVTIDALPEEQESVDATNHDKLDGEVEAAASIEIVKQASKSSADSFHTPPMVTSPNHPLAVPDLEDIADVTPEEPTSETPTSSVDAPPGNHISSTSTLVKSSEMAAHSTVDNLDTHPPNFYSTSSSSGSNDGDNVSQLQLPEDSISLMTAEDSQLSHYGSVDDDKDAINLTSLAEEISRLKAEDKEALVEEGAVHENGWVVMENEGEVPSNKLSLNTPQNEKEQKFPVKDITEETAPEFHSNCINHDSSDVLLPGGDFPSDITTTNITSSKPLNDLLNHKSPLVILQNEDKILQEANLLVDSGNGEDAGLSPTLSSASVSDGRSSCHSSNLYTPQTASSEVQDNEVNGVTYTYTHMHTHRHTLNTHTHTHTYTHTHTRTHTHAHTHTHTHS